MRLRRPLKAAVVCCMTCAASAQSKAPADGKLRTSHATGFDITERPVDRVVVWERVGT